ncbi:MAG TPA: hypothetical protein RMH99_01040 [Sandaracinaceae bacterium LLY-WYZ-13_1]|nr:hypothetical protein [Sandaracinaceae bacterium LLY-WYZ-13_1]
MTPPAVFELVRTIELDVALGDEPMTLRLEILRARHQKQLYRARLWRLDLFRQTPSFPRDEEDEPSERSDDSLFVEWGDLLDGDYDELIAPNAEAAEERVLADLRRALAAASWAV